MTIKVEEDPKMSNRSSPRNHNPAGNHSLQLLINQEDHGNNKNKFFSKLLTKESNPSFRVYYGGVAGSVPFTWESQPGTPKHKFFMTADDSSLPPLTPPPSASFRSKNDSELKSHSSKKVIVRRSGSFFHRALWRMGIGRSSSLNLGSSTSLRSSSLGFVTVKPLEYRLGRRRFSSRGSFDSITPFDDDEDDHVGSPRGSSSCFCIGGPRGCYGW